MPELKDIIKTYGAIPPLTQFKRPMFVGPHPDDIEFGCGGLIAKMKEQNVPVTYVVLTDGAAGGEMSPEQMKQVREQESIEAARFLGVEAVEFCELPDGGDYSVEDAIKALIPIVLKHRPDILFAPDPLLKTECHPDHLKAGEAASPSADTGSRSPMIRKSLPTSPLPSTSPMTAMSSKRSPRNTCRPRSMPSCITGHRCRTIPRDCFSIISS